MKKLLSVLAAVGVVASSTVSVVACGTKKEDKNTSKPEEPKKDITQVVQDFEQDVTRIWSEHYEKEVAGNLIGVESMEEGNEFLNKYNIQKFSKPENKNKLTTQYKKQLTNDVEKMFKVELLKEKLNQLKKINKYKLILDEVDSVFEHVELAFNDNFEINSGEIVPGSYIGNVIVDYKIVTQYKGNVDIEKYKQSGTLKYTSTESESFKKVGEAMYKNIAKDMFTSSETQKYVNLKWSDIKGKNADSDAYASSNAQLKKYYNENDEFHNSLLKTINDKYFKQQFPSIEIKYDKKSIYKTDSFVEKNSNQLIINSLYKDEDNYVDFDMRKLDEKNQIKKILLADNSELSKFLLKFINPASWTKIRNNYKTVQDTFLNTFLGKNEISEYQNTNSYKLAIAMGYIEFIGPSIKIGSGESTYNHQLPDFKLAISYSMNGITDENYKTLVNFYLKLFEVYEEVFNPIELENQYEKIMYVFGFRFKSFEFKNQKNQENITGNDVNALLKDFNQIYYKKLSDSLKEIKNRKIFFELHFKNYNSILKDWILTGYKHPQAVLYLSKFREDSNYKIFENLESMKFNLLGFIKFRIFFDPNGKKSTGFMLF